MHGHDRLTFAVRIGLCTDPSVDAIEQSLERRLLAYASRLLAYVINVESLAEPRLWFGRDGLEVTSDVDDVPRRAILLQQFNKPCIFCIDDR